MTGPSSWPRHTRVELLAPAELEQRWREPAVRVFEQLLPNGSGTLVLEEHEELGCRVRAPRFGSSIVSPDGAWVAFAPPDAAPRWVWERFLVAQILPLAAVLQGLEVFHASAIVLADRLVALSGPCGTGKTTLAIELVRRGARLFADDVLVLDPDGPEPTCHPGAGAANVRDARLVELAERGLPPFGEILGRGGRTLRVVIEAEQSPRALERFYFLRRDPAVDRPRLERVDRADELFAATFNFAIRTPARLARQLAACSSIARSAEVVQLAVPAELEVSETAALIEREMLGTE